MHLPDSMLAIDCPVPGGPEALVAAHVPLPIPGAGDVLIRVEAAGINRPDIAQRKGLYPPPKEADPRLGLEVAGEIVAVGEGVDAQLIGQRRCALTNGGGYAQYCTAPFSQSLPWPKGFTAVQAAALPETYFTVWANVFMLGGLKPSESLLVHGGSGGIGLTAIQLASALGNTVYATAGSAEKCSACTAHGAAAAFNYRTEDFAERLGTCTKGEGVDVILDMVGAPYMPRNIASLKKDGRLVIIAMMGGSKANDVDLARIMTRRLTVTGSTMRPRTREEKAAIAQDLHAHVWPLLEQGRCLPVIDKVFPLSQAADAHRYLESGNHIGKIMLAVTD